MKMAVYVATAESRPGLVKIGITKNPDSRRATLAAKIGGRVRMPFVIWRSSEREARTLEKSAHWRLWRMGVHHEGEWFRGTSQTGVWGLYEGLRWDNRDWRDGPPDREAPLLCWGIGYLCGRRVNRFNWENINAALSEIERAN